MNKTFLKQAGRMGAGDLSDTKTVALEQKLKELKSQLVIYKVKLAKSIIQFKVRPLPKYKERLAKLYGRHMK